MLVLVSEGFEFFGSGVVQQALDGHLTPPGERMDCAGSFAASLTPGQLPVTLELVACTRLWH